MSPPGTSRSFGSGTSWTRSGRLPEIPPEARVADLGSGAGLPGLPLAIVLPDRSFTLIEMRRGRAAFLESVVDDLGLRNAKVLLGKVETAEGPFDVVPRARLLGPDGKLDRAPNPC